MKKFLTYGIFTACAFVSLQAHSQNTCKMPQIITIDVNRTPIFKGPTPIPYPNVGMTTTVGKSDPKTTPKPKAGDKKATYKFCDEVGKKIFGPPTYTIRSPFMPGYVKNNPSYFLPPW